MHQGRFQLVINIGQACEYNFEKKEKSPTFWKCRGLGYPVILISSGSSSSSTRLP
jgi:hypothetical protein